MADAKSDLDYDAILRDARERAGVGEFRDQFYLELLRRLLIGFAEESNLNDAGRAIQRERMVGLLATNLPYGDRIGSREGDIRQLYVEVGDTLKQRFSGWQAAVLAAEASPYRAIGLKPSRAIPLMNGSIPCRLLLFDLYVGSRRA